MKTSYERKQRYKLNQKNGKRYQIDSSIILFHTIHLPKRRLGRVKCDSTQSNTDVTKSSTVFVRTVLLYESNNGRTIAENYEKKI